MVTFTVKLRQLQHRNSLPLNPGAFHCRTDLLLHPIERCTTYTDTSLYTKCYSLFVAATDVHAGNATQRWVGKAACDMHHIGEPTPRVRTRLSSMFNIGPCLWIRPILADTTKSQMTRADLSDLSPFKKNAHRSKILLQGCLVHRQQWGMSASSNTSMLSNAHLSSGVEHSLGKWANW